MRDAMTWGPGRADSGFRVILLLIAAWLAWSLAQVNIEFDDGYATLTNALYFLGDAHGYFSNRGPLMAFAMMPAVLMSQALGLHPLDVRLAHGTMVFLTLAYLYGSWRLLVRVHGSELCTLLAYAAAMATPVFFSYAPFVNLDIFPGVLALLMVWLAEQQLRSPSNIRWLVLVALGTSLAALKQTYALVWIGIVAMLPLTLLMGRADASTWRNARGLLLAAVVSGALTWMIYAAALSTPFGAEPFWLRPWLQVAAINANYAAEGGPWVVFSPWIYLENLWAYGILAMLLILPAVILALRSGTSFERLLALVWLFLVVMLHLTPYKEVRYLAFLAPFNAVLLVPLLRKIWSGRRAFRWLMLAILMASLALAAGEASRLNNPYYRQALLAFLGPLPADGTLPGRLIMGGPLSFVSPERQAYSGDRYHRITHITPGSIVSMYGYPVDHFWQIRSTAEVQADRVRPGDIWLLTSSLLVRTKPYVRGNQEGLDQNFFQLFAVAERLELEEDSDGYRIVGPEKPASWIVPGTQADASPVMASGRIDAATAEQLFGSRQLAPGTPIIAFRVLRHCGLTQCLRLD
jgi:hypothetical protein